MIAVADQAARRARRRLAAAGGLLALVWSLAVAWNHVHGGFSLLDRLEETSADLRLRAAGPLPPPSGLAVIGIDDATIAQAGAFPLPRAMLAALIDALHAAGARTVAVDLLFLEPGPAADDDALLAALSHQPSVIGAAARFEEARQAASVPIGSDRPLPAAAVISWPAAPFSGAVLAGLVNISVDGGGTPRHVPLIVAMGNSVVPGFVLAATAVATRTQPRFDADGVTIADHWQPLDLAHALPLRPYGPAGTIATISAADVLGGRFDRELVRDAIVVVGATALGSGDTFTTPFDDTVPGVEILATGIANLRDGTALRRDRLVRAVDAAAIVALPVAIAIAMGLAGPAAAAAIVAVALLGWTAVTFVAFAEGIWLSLAAPLAAALPVAALCGTARRFIENRIAERLAVGRRALEALQSPIIASRLDADPSFLARPREQAAAVMFLDLSGFTGLSERLGAERTQGFLDGFYRRLGQVTAETDGFLCAFLGDGAMIVYGFPDPGDDAARALQAIRRFDAAFGAWLGEIPEAAGMSVRYGLHFGPIVVSRLGGDGRQHITATGDTVNVASRLLEVAKQNRAHAAVGDPVFEALGAERRPAFAHAYGPATSVSIRGRSEPLPVRLWFQ